MNKTTQNHKNPINYTNPLSKSSIRFIYLFEIGKNTQNFPGNTIPVRYYNLLMATLGIIFLLFLGACSQKNPDFFPQESSQTENLNGRVIKYSIQLTSAANPIDSTLSVEGTVVYLSMYDSVYTDTADASGLLTFGHLAAGTLNVRISHPQFYTYNYIVNLSADSSSIYDTQNYRNMSSIVHLLPVSEEFQGHFNAEIKADTNFNIQGAEKVTFPIQFTAFLNDSTTRNFAELSDGQTIIDAWMEMPAFIINSGNGTAEFNLPAATNGLTWNLSSGSITIQQVTATDTTEKVYYLPETRLKAYPYLQSYIILILKTQ